MRAKIVRWLQSGNIPTSPAVWGKLSVIGSMYMAQTLPQAFVTQLLPAIYRDQGLALSKFWVFSLILAPGWFRWAWAPVVDAYGSKKIGRRKSWIIPCTIFSVIGYIALIFANPSLEALNFIIVILIIQALFMGTQEMAVDAYTIENLRPNERGVGAGARVFLEAFAELIALVVLARIYDIYGWAPAVVFAAVFLLVFTLPVLVRKEGGHLSDEEVAAAAAKIGKPSLLHFFKRKDSILILTNLVAGGLALGMLLPILGAFLVDKGFSISSVGLIVGLAIFVGILTGVVISVPVTQKFGVKNAMLVFTPLVIPAALFTSWAASSESLGGITAFLALTALTAVIAMVYVIYTTARITWASQIQAATDYAIGTAFIKIGQTVGIALSGFLAAFAGWTVFFITYGVIVLCVGAYFVFTHDMLQRMIEKRETPVFSP